MGINGGKTLKQIYNPKLNPYWDQILPILILFWSINYVKLITPFKGVLSGLMTLG